MSLLLPTFINLSLLSDANQRSDDTTSTNKYFRLVTIDRAPVLQVCCLSVEDKTYQLLRLKPELLYQLKNNDNIHFQPGGSRVPQQLSFATFFSLGLTLEI